MPLIRRSPRIYHARRVSESFIRRIGIVVLLIAALVVAWVAFALLRSLPPPRLVLSVPATSTINGAPLVLRPPLGAEEAVAIGGVGTIAVAGEQAPTPIASLTKIMSALVVLHDHPLALGESGPNIPVTAADVATYQLEGSQGDSVVEVRAGEQLSELQALEGALIPSGDNLIQLLATWDAGSTSTFVAKMNALAHQLGLDQTHYAGPSGVDPATTSTATDQLRLAEVAMTNPVFSGIVAMAQVSLPVAGVQYNVDADLGSDGIDGIKTGWVPQGGGCFVFSATDLVGGRQVSVLGTVLGEQGTTPIPTALAAARKLVVSTEKTIRTLRVGTGSTVAKLITSDGPSVPVVTSTDLSLLGWIGARAQFHVQLARRVGSTFPAGSRVGTIAVSIGAERRTATLRVTSPVRAPSFAWRLTHL